MPDCVTNLVTFGEDAAAKDAFHRMLNAVRMDGEALGSITFDKIIPMPENVRQTMGNITKTGINWRQWCEQNRGTDREPLDWYPLKPDGDTMCFFTAWTAVPQIIKKLSEMFPAQTVTYQWAENENPGMNTGEMVFKNGETVSECIPEDFSREAFDMSTEILGIEPAELNLYLTENQCCGNQRKLQFPECRKQNKNVR